MNKEKMKQSGIQDHLINFILMIIATVPLVYFYRIEQVPFKIFILGTGSWGIGNIFKILFHQLIVKRMEKRKRPLLFTALTNGFISGFFELSASLFIIWLMADKVVFDLNAIISFGLAIGSFEIFIVAMSSGNNLLKGTALEDSSGKLLEFLKSLKGMKYFLFNHLFPVLERLIAMLLHVTTRGLVFFSFFSGNAIPVIFALLIYVMADGVIGYQNYQSGKIASTKGFIYIHLNLLVLAFLSGIAFILYLHEYRSLLPI